MMAQSCKLPSATPRQASRKRSPVDRLLDPALFKALGDPTRVRLLACVSKCSRECAVTEIAQGCSVDLSVVSRHLATMERAGLVESRREGRTVYYRVRYADLCAHLRDLADALESCQPDCDCDC